VWSYTGAASLESNGQKSLQDHPTIKPVAILQDALSDLTNRGDVVLDPFLGSGSNLIAAEKCSRVCRGVELDPHCIDVVVRRYEAATGTGAILVDTNEPFNRCSPQA
jgi:DNA modification methylase